MSNMEVMNYARNAAKEVGEDQIMSGIDRLSLFWASQHP